MTTPVVLHVFIEFTSFCVQYIRVQLNGVLNNLLFSFLSSKPQGICKIYEEHLRQLHPQSPSITYDISELFKFIDNLHDLSCLV